MPNHVTNKLRFENISDDLWVHICKVLQGDDPERSYGSVDFNVLIPMPEELKNIEASSLGDNGYALYARYMHGSAGCSEEEKARLEAYLRQGVDNKTWELGKLYYENSVNYGFTTWYGWANANWGTKWNAYDCTHNNTAHEFEFLTAWCSPEPIIEKISERFPDITIVHRWADEDVGNNVGRREYLGGHITEDDCVIEGSAEAYELAADILGLDLYDDLGLVLGDDGEYHNADEEDL